MRVVLDTNILISAAMKPDGLEARLIAMQAEGRIRAHLTDAILTEYREVLQREKFRAWRSQAETILATLTGTAVHVSPSDPAHACPDDDDNRFLECADAADAAFLITGNLRHYPIQWKQTRILNARMFFDLIGRKEQADSRPGPRTSRSSPANSSGEAS
ncbi:MAG: putative toxin-antitoxin system toxin component, PIN family [Acidobacteriota bacterium]|nr:putative toxin-antitoxin system toxin component, PIN family [Acidobacteriota bacterium]